MSNVVTIYTRFERFWHWMQALLIFLMTVTGLEMHGFWTFFGFKKAVLLHNFSAGSWLVLMFALFVWIFTTGQWKQYLPTTDGLGATIRFYAFGIFKGEKHPHKKTEVSKLNPVQRLSYLALLLGIVPLMLITGLLYYFYHDWAVIGLSGRVDAVAILHTLGAFAMVAFVIVHVYMTTTGHTVFAHLKAMITGREDLDEH